MASLLRGRLGNTRGDDLRYQRGVTADVQQSPDRPIVVPYEVQVWLVYADDAISSREASLVTLDQVTKHTDCSSVSGCQNNFVEFFGAAFGEKYSVASEAHDSCPAYYRTVPNRSDEAESNHGLPLQWTVLRSRYDGPAPKAT